MELQSPTPLQQVRAPTPIYLVHRTNWHKYFRYRKWRCDERTDLLGAHSSLEEAHGAVIVDFKNKAELIRTRWLPDLWKEQKEKNIDEWPPGKQFNYINQFMKEKKREDKGVDLGWTYLVTSTSLWHHDKKRKVLDLASTAAAAGDERMTMKPKVGACETLQLVVVKQEKDDILCEFNKENNCPSCLRLGSKVAVPERVVAEEYSQFKRERRSLGYYCQQ